MKDAFYGGKLLVLTDMLGTKSSNALIFLPLMGEAIAS